jgi:hypothetical protein
MPDLSGIPVVGPTLSSHGIGAPDPPATPPDTSQRDQIVAALAAAHGGIFGKPAPQTTKGTGGQLQATGYDLYTFGDGTTVEVDPDTGATQNLKLAPVKTTATKTPQDVLGDQGLYIVGGKVYQKNPDPNGLPIETDASKATQVLADAKTQADTTLAQAQTAKADIDAKIAADPTNQALQQQKTQADNALTAAQTASQQATAAATAIDTQLKQAAAPSQIALAGAQATNLQATAAATAATTPSTVALNNAQAAKTAADAALASDPTNIALQQAKTRADTALAQAQAAATTKPTALTADTVSPYIPTMDASGQITYQPNQNRITATEATSQLASQLGLKVAAGSMSEKDAQALITNAINTMNAHVQEQQNQITAAGDILSNVRGNAQTGAGLLQQRAQTAQGMLGQVLGIAQGGTASGSLGGGMMAAPAGVGGQLVSGISNWTTGLMGGQGTMDSAARLLQMADPRSSLADPSSQQAISTLAQLMDKYHQATGMPHPAVAATQAMQQSGQNGGMAAPATAPNPAYASTGAGAVTAGYAGSGGNPWGNAPNGFPAPTTVQSPYSSSGLGPVGAGFAAPSTASPTIVIHMPGAA